MLSDVTKFPIRNYSHLKKLQISSLSIVSLKVELIYDVVTEFLCSSCFFVTQRNSSDVTNFQSQHPKFTLKAGILVF